MSKGALSSGLGGGADGLRLRHGDGRGGVGEAPRGTTPHRHGRLQGESGLVLQEGGCWEWSNTGQLLFALGCGPRKKCQTDSLVNGTQDYNLRNPSSLILIHTQLCL